MHKESSMLYQCLVDAMVVKVDFLCQVERVNSFYYCEAHILPKGHKSQRTRMSVNRLSDLINNDQIIISGQSKVEILKDIENILKNNYGEHEVSAELDYSGPRTVNRMHSEPESDFH